MSEYILSSSISLIKITRDILLLIQFLFFKKFEFSLSFAPYNFKKNSIFFSTYNQSPFYNGGYKFFIYFLRPILFDPY